jgi:hypothetical protein
MPASPSPDVVPFGADQTVYLVVDSFGSRNAVYREAEFERADLETTIGDLLSGRFNPVRVIAYNTLEHWTEDVSAQIAAEIQSRCDMDGEGARACKGFCQLPRPAVAAAGARTRLIWSRATIDTPEFPSKLDS